MLAAILWACGALYWAFCDSYGCLYIIISIYVALRGIAAVFVYGYYYRLAHLQVLLLVLCEGCA
nr:MAG TPA: hypothetical protein [Caudoviricetes sp.]